MTRPRSGSRSAVLAASAALLAGWPLPGQAGSFTLKVAPLHSRTPTGPCPQTLSLMETLQPFREGSYGINGRAPLGAIATGWRLASRDAFPATLSADLRPAYRGCTASAGIVRADNAPFKEHSYLRLRFNGGQAHLILDMAGMRDPNGYTPQILSAGVNQGLPVWSWGGSD
ncbi:MAG: hypothetical protein ACKO0M_15580 [Cyanobium sp.]